MSLEKRLSRRNFLKAGAGSLAAALLGAEAAKASGGTDISNGDDTDSNGNLDFRVDMIPRKEGVACIPVKINDNGKVIGYYLDLTGTGSRTFFLYKEGTVRELNFDVPDGFYPTGINGFPDFVFGQIDGDSLLYRLGKKEPINLGFFASDINDRYVVGHKQGWSYRYDLETGKQTELGNFEAVAVDKQGRITGNNGSTAVVWENEQIKELESYREGTKNYPTYARDISNGIVIGDIEYSLNEYAACMWDKDGKVTKLPLMNAAAINNGMILGSSQLYLPHNEKTADLWEVLHGMVGTDINKKGQIIGTLGEGSEIEGVILNIGNKSYIPPDTASLSLEFTDINYQFVDPRHYYHHTRIFTETNGVGVTLTKGELCYQSTGTCDSALVNYRIEGNDQLVQTDKKFYTPYPSDRFTLKYYGTDDNGNSVSVEQSMSHP